MTAPHSRAHPWAMTTHRGRFHANGVRKWYVHRVKARQRPGVEKYSLRITALSKVPSSVTHPMDSAVGSGISSLTAETIAACAFDESKAVR